MNRVVLVVNLFSNVLGMWDQNEKWFEGACCEM